MKSQFQYCELIDAAHNSKMMASKLSRMKGYISHNDSVEDEYIKWKSVFFFLSITCVFQPCQS